MQKPPLIPRSKWQPATFLERGVTVPFTTPAIAMSRLRPTENGNPELIVANPSGADGSYVFPLRALPDFTTPSMHDRLLFDILIELPVITPTDIRRAARRAAATGAAGRSVAKSAKAAAVREEQEQLLTNLLLITLLLRQAGFTTVDWRRLDLADRATRAMTRQYLTQYEQRLGMKPDAMLALVEELCPLLASVGISDGAFEATHETTVKRLRTLTTSLRQWARGESVDQAKGVELIAACTEFTLHKTEQALGRVRQHTENMVNLLHKWRSNDKKLRHELTLADWLLDGWVEIAALWEATADDDRETQRTVLGRIESLVPVLPKEALADGGAEETPHRQLTQKRWVRLNEDWRANSLLNDDSSKVEAARGLAA